LREQQNQTILVGNFGQYDAAILLSWLAKQNIVNVTDKTFKAIWCFVLTNLALLSGYKHLTMLITNIK
jgi:hypothetical protein